MSEQDIFIINKIYPDPKDIFSATTKPLSAIKDNCLFVLDTNALLLPYTTSSKSVDEIKRVYQTLIKQGRLFVPAQVAREFARNRPEKIKELFQQLNRKRDKVKNLYAGKYPLLQDVKEYNEAIELEKKVDEIIKEYSAKLAAVMDHIKDWTWNDPVSQTYNELFDENTIVDHGVDEATIKKDLAHRNANKIPPGYKDGGKEDDGIGDLLIWLTIISLAVNQKNDVVFVSGDEKADWFYRSDSQVLYPRFELLAEFRSKTDKKSFHIIKLSELLTLLGADVQVVKEVKIEETTATIQESPALAARKIERAINRWLIDAFGNEWLIEIGADEFPHAIMTQQNAKIGVQILAPRHHEMLARKLDETLSRIYFEFKNNGFSKFMLFIVHRDLALVERIYRTVERVLAKYAAAELTIEIMHGVINDEGQFIRM